FGWQTADEEDAQEEAPRKKRAAKPKQVSKEAAAEQHDEEAEDADAPERRSFVSLGWLYHFLYALRARLALLPAYLLGLIFRRRHRVVTLHRDAAAVRLEEPHSEPYSNPADDQAREID